MAMGKFGKALANAFSPGVRVIAFTATLRVSEEDALLDALGGYPREQWDITRLAVDRPNISISLRIQTGKAARRKHWAGSFPSRTRLLVSDPSALQRHFLSLSRSSLRRSSASGRRGIKLALVCWGASAALSSTLRFRARQLTYIASSWTFSHGFAQQSSSYCTLVSSPRSNAKRT